MKLVVSRSSLQGAAARLGLSYVELAARMEINESQLHRVLAGRCEPGTRFLAGLLAVVGLTEFSRVCTIVADDGKNPAPQQKLKVC